MADAHENLGKASLDLTANLAEFRRNMREGRKEAGGMRDSLDHLAEIAEIAEKALGRVKAGPGQAAETRVSLETILSGVRNVSDEAHDAARALDHVRLTEAQATESEAAAHRIASGVDEIGDEARQTDRALSRLGRRLAEIRALGAGGGGFGNRPGYGVGPFGAGYGRLGLLGTLITAGTLLAPAAGPGAVGLLAAIPTLSFGAVGALGTLVLAFKDVGKAIGGDKKAFDELTPSAQKFVLTIRSLSGFYKNLRETAASNLFPGVTAGLRAALSPGTVGVVTRGVGQFGGAIGSSVAQWGRYFGSADFQRLLGPLLTAGAQNFRILSGAALQFFQALTVLGAAAIPFTRWLLLSITHGATLLNQWIRMQSATGGLSRGLTEAQKSLTLVWKLFVALAGVVYSLGRALYPVSKVLVVQLTQGLNWLAGAIDRNRTKIREIVGGALAAFVSVIKFLVPLLGRMARLLGRVVDAMGGWKTAFQIVIGGYLASKFIGLAGSIGAARKEAGLLRLALLALGNPAVLAAIGLAGAAFAIYKAFTSTQPKVVGKTDVGTNVVESNGQLYIQPPGSPHLTRLPPGTKFKKVYTGAIATGADRSNHPGLAPADTPTKPKAKPLVPGTHAWYMKYLGYDPTVIGGSVFGKVPPFTKNLDSNLQPPVIPASASHLLSLAAAADSAGKFKTELTDLSRADKLLHSAYLDAKGKARTQLFTAITATENKMRSVRAKIAKAAQAHRAAELALAVDVAKNAVASATEGSAEYDKAVAAEAKALRAEISYWDKRANNLKLAADVRDKALKTELAFKKQLATLLKPGAHKAGENEAQFLSSFRDIITAFAPNAFPIPGGSGKTDTHLYDIVNESRKSNAYLRDLAARSAFPSTGYQIRAATAVAG